MKKSIYFLAAGCALALSACTSEEVVQESVRQSNAIGFQSAVGNATRGIDATNPLTSFNVYGYYTKPGFEANPVTVFDGDKVTGSGSDWSYGTTYRYWVPGATYYFYAYSCENKELTENGSPSMSFDDDGAVSVGISGYVCNNEHQHDLIFAVNDTGIEGKEKDNAKVPFSFNHVLSKVKVKFVSQFAPGYDLAISNVRLVNVYGTGDFDPKAEDVWTVTGTQNVSVSLKAGTNMTASAKDGETAAKDAVTSETYVIPHEYKNNGVTISFRVDITNGETAVMSRVFTGTWKPNWVEGYAYTYTINISGETASLEKIEFGDMNVGNWTDTAGPSLTFGVSTPQN